MQARRPTSVTYSVGESDTHVADLVKELPRLLVESREESEDEGLHHWPQRVLQGKVERLVDVEKRKLRYPSEIVIVSWCAYIRQVRVGLLTLTEVDAY